MTARIDLAEFGLRELSADQHDRRDAILIRCSRLWRDGIRIVLPPPAVGRRP